MSQHVEWGEVYVDSTVILDYIGSVEDAYGTTNAKPVLMVGECAIEGTPEAFRALGQSLLDHFSDTS